METRSQGRPPSKRGATLVSLARGTGWGLAAGFVGTLVMDLILMGVLTALGRPASTCFSIVGDTAAQFFSKVGAEIAGGVPAGVAVHYLVGPALGAIFGAAAARVDRFRAVSLRKALIRAVLYVEILSQPILAATPVLLKMTIAEILMWFGGSLVMHLIWGLVLGAVIYYGLRPVDRRDQVIEPTPASKGGSRWGKRPASLTSRAAVGYPHDPEFHAVIVRRTEGDLRCRISTTAGNPPANITRTSRRRRRGFS